MNGQDDIHPALTRLIRSLVDRPDEVRLDMRVKDDDVRLTVEVAPEDIGQVIGRQGRTARALRTLLEARGVDEQRTYGLEIGQP